MVFGRVEQVLRLRRRKELLWRFLDRILVDGSRSRIIQSKKDRRRLVPNKVVSMNHLNDQVTFINDLRCNASENQTWIKVGVVIYC